MHLFRVQALPQLRLDDTTYSLEDKLNFTVLEPTCGNGNFLVELLRRKLHFAFSANEDDLVINLFKAVSTLQGSSSFDYDCDS